MCDCSYLYLPNCLSTHREETAAGPPGQAGRGCPFLLAPCGWLFKICPGRSLWRSPALPSGSVARDPAISGYECVCVCLPAWQRLGWRVIGVLHSSSPFHPKLLCALSLCQEIAIHTGTMYSACYSIPLSFCSLHDAVLRSHSLLHAQSWEAPSLLFSCLGLQ